MKREGDVDEEADGAKIEKENKMNTTTCYKTQLKAQQIALGKYSMKI